METGVTKGFRVYWPEPW